MANLIKINLDPAAVLYREKLLLRQRSEIKGKVQQLPYFGWTMERSKMSGMSDKDMIRNWVRFIAYVQASIASKADHDDAFVSLIKHDSTPDQFSIKVRCPDPRVFEPLSDPKLRESLPVVEIRHKYALIPGWTPVVFKYEAATNSVLATNESHIGQPHYFLDPDHCKTTSGLLNFVGVFSLIEQMVEGDSSDGNQFEQAQQWLNTAMKVRADEWLRWFFHLLDSNVILDPARVLIDSENPENFYYDYSSK